ncbi:MAG: FGGY-family carbohydrate kinase [Anaerolineae bacterium]|nr:FGGY-family carbohydrate kinase [Anaerolineae bacterium]
MADYLLGIDYGTGGAKACIIDPEGSVLGFTFEEYPFIHERPGWSEHEPALYWEIACRLVKGALLEAGIRAAEVRGIAVSSALPSLVMVARDHHPIQRAYNLMDRRATRQVQWLKDRIGEERMFQISGNRLEDHPTIVNLLWEKENRPESYQRIYKALTIDGFITLKLTGRATLNVSAGGFYGVAYDLRELTFDTDLLGEIGIDPELMPTLFDCTDIVGEVTAEAAAETGLVPGIPVAAGQVDCNAGYLGAGATEEGDIQCNLGSVGNFGLVYKDVEFSFSPIGRLMINFPYTVDSHNTYITVPTTMTGGQSIRYLRDSFSQYEVEVERVLGVSSYDLLNLEARRVPAGSEGLIILPFLMGERTPIWDVHARGVIFGLSLNHTKGHIVRAMMEAVAYAMYDSYRLIEESGLKVNLPLVLNEGGAVSALWRQIIADVFDVPIVLVKRRTGAPFGDAILAGVATGAYPDFSVAREWAEYIEPMEPDPANHRRYMDYFSLYKQLYEHVKEDFLALAELRERT